MPITAQAAKKLRHDRKRAEENARTKAKLRMLLKAMRKTPSKKARNAVYVGLDKAAKTRVIHPNKAARLKSRLARLLKKK